MNSKDSQELPNIREKGRVPEDKSRDCSEISNNRRTSIDKKGYSLELDSCIENSFVNYSNNQISNKNN
jgi:hypothetical protein